MTYRSTTYYDYEKQEDIIDKILEFLVTNEYNFIYRRLKKPTRCNNVSIRVTGMTFEQYLEYRKFLAKVEA